MTSDFPGVYIGIMTSQKTPFLMAAVVAIFGLFWAQIAAPTQLKPLTNHLLDYPHAIPALVFERGIYRANVSHSHPVATMPTKLKDWLNSYLPKPLEIMCTTNDERGFCGGVNERQARYGGYAGGGTGSNSNAFIGSDAEKAGQLAAIIASNKGASIEVIKNAIKAAGLEVPAVIPTKTPPATTTTTTTAPTQSAAYIAQYGTEVGRYGYVYADGSVAGTTKVADGSLRVLALGDTQSAAARNSQVVASQVSAMSDQEILKSTGSSCTTNCQDAVSAAVTTILANSAVFDTAVKEEIIANQQQNSQAQEAYQAKIQAFLSPTTDLKALAGCDPAHPGECRDLTAESYLRGLVTDSATLHELLSTRDTNIANYKKDLELVKIFADSSKSNSDIANSICGDDRDCRMNFVREDYLNKLTNKDLASQAKQQLAQNQMVAKYLTTTSAQLSQEYCRGISSDRCKYLLDGGLLKDIGISAEKALELNRQKQANYAISRYELGQTGNITSTAIDTQAIYQTEYLACMTNTQGRGDCEAIANQQTKKKLSQAAPVNYQTEYDLAFKTCRSSPANSIDQCQQYAQKTATKLTNNSQTGATYVPQLEELYLASTCNALGGANCNNVDESLTSLSAYTNDPELTLINIQNQKNKIYQNSMSQERIAFTLQNMDPANYDRLAADPNTDWVAQEAALTELRQDFGTNIVLGWNNFTAGRFKRGNDLLLESANGNGMTRTILSIGMSNATFGLVSADTFGSAMGLENPIDKWGVISGGIIQGGDAAFVVTTAVALPLAPSAGAFLGTGFGIASSTQMIGTATDACTQAPGSEACHTAIAIATISVAGTGLGLANSLVGVAEAGATLSLAQKTIVAGNIGTEFLGAVTFGKMAYEACGENSTSLDCTSGILMAAASFGKLASTNFGLVAKLAQIEGKLGTVALTGGSALQGIHTASAITFGISACSKVFEGPANIDTMSMCAMGISGAVQDPLVAKLTGPKTASTPTLTEIKSPEQIRLEQAKVKVDAARLTLENNKEAVTPQLRENLNKAEIEYARAQELAGTALKPPEIAESPVKPQAPPANEKSSGVLTRLREVFSKPVENPTLTTARQELALREAELTTARERVTGLENNLEKVNSSVRRQMEESLASAREDLALATVKHAEVARQIAALTPPPPPPLLTRLREALFSKKATAPTGVELILDPLFKTSTEKTTFEENLARISREKANQERSILSEESSTRIAQDPAQAKNEANKTLTELASNGQKAEIEKLTLAHEKLANSRELSRLETIAKSNRSAEQKARIKELQAIPELSNRNKLVDEYNLVLDELRTTVLADKQNGLKRMNEVQEALQKLDILTEIRTLEQKIAVEKAKGSTADQTYLTSLEKNILDLSVKKEIVIPAELGLTSEVQQKVTDIIRDTEHRLAIFEDGSRSSRANQIDTFQKLLSGKFTAVELTTAGGKTMVGAMTLKARLEIFGNETGVYLTKEGQQSSIRTQLDKMTAVGDSVIILDVYRLGEPGYVEALLKSKYIVTGPNDVNFLQNNTLDRTHPSYEPSVAILDKMTKNVGTYYDEAQLTLDPNVAGVNQKGNKKVAEASKELAAKEVAEILTKEAILVNGDAYAHQNWDGGKSALADRLLSPDGVALETARFSSEAEVRITNSLRKQNGAEFFNEVSNNRFETIEQLVSRTGKDAAAIEHVLDQISMIDTYAKSLDTGYERAVDSTLKNQAKPGETRYESEVSIPKNGALSEGQTFSGDMYLTMEYVGAIRNGQTPNTVGLSTTSTKAIKSTIMDYVKLVSADARNGQSAVTGTLGGMRGAAETVLGMRIHASSDATVKIVNTADALDGALIKQENTHAVSTTKEGLQLVEDMFGSRKVKGSVKIAHALENMSSTEFAQAIERGRKTAGEPKKTYFAEEKGSVYFEITLDANGKVVRKTETTQQAIQERFQNGEPDLILIIDKGGSTGDSIKTPENVQFIPIFVEGQPTYSIAQEGSRGNRGNTLDMETFSIVIGGTKEPMATSGTAESRLANANHNFDFKTWRTNMEKYEATINKNNATSVMNNLVEAQARQPIVDLVRSTNTKIADWASKTLIDVFFAGKDGRSLSAKDVAQLSIDRRNEIAREGSQKMQDIFKDPANKAILEQISRENPEAFARMQANRDFIKNNPNGFEYAPFGPLEAINSRDSFLLSNDLQSGADAHRKSISPESESKYIASTEGPKTETIAQTPSTSKKATPPVDWSTLEIKRGYSPTTGKFNPIEWLFPSATTKAIKTLKIAIDNGTITQTQAIDRVTALELNPAQKHSIITGALFTTIPSSIDLDGNISPIIHSTPAMPTSIVPVLTIPRAISIQNLVTLPSFTQLIIETDDGDVYTVTQNGIDITPASGVSSHSEFDPNLLPSDFNDIKRISYNGNNLTTNQLTSAGLILDTPTPITDLVELDIFRNLRFELPDGEVVVIESLGGEININHRSAEGTQTSQAYTSDALLELIPPNTTPISIVFNGNTLPVGALTTPSNKEVTPSFITRIITNLSNWIRSPRSEKGAGPNPLLFFLSRSRSLINVIALPDFQTITLPLKSGKVVTFTNLRGVRYMSIATPQSGIRPTQQSITMNEIREWLITNRDNIDLDNIPNSYSVPKRSVLENVNIFLTNLSVDYLASTIANQTPQYTTLSNPSSSTPKSYTALNDAIELTVTEAGYLLKPTGNQPVLTHSFFGVNEIPAEGIVVTEEGYLTILIGDQSYGIYTIDGALRIHNDVTSHQLIFTDHLSRFNQVMQNIETYISNISNSFVFRFAPNDNLKDNVSNIIEDLEGQTHIPNPAINTGNIAKDILLGILKSRYPNLDIKEATMHYVAAFLFNSDNPEVLALESVIRTSGLLYDHFELARYREFTPQTKIEALIGNPAINWTFTNNHTLNLAKIFPSDNKSLMQYLDEGQTVVLVRPDGTRTFFNKERNEYIAITGDRENRHESLNQLSSNHFPTAEELSTASDASPYLISVTTASQDTMLVEPIDLYVTTKQPIAQENRSGFRQWLDRFLGIEVGIIQFPGLTDNLPSGVRKYADSIGVPYSQISYTLTPQSQANPSGPQFYVVSIFKDASKEEEVYKIGIDENGVGWGGGVQINQSKHEVVYDYPLLPRIRYSSEYKPSVSDSNIEIGSKYKANSQDEYEITGHLGSGSYADVYQATHTQTGKTVAIKIIKKIPPETTSMIPNFDSTSYARDAFELTMSEFDFLKSAESRLPGNNHFAKAISTLKSNVDDNIIGYVMEHVDGVTLSEYLNDHSLTQEQIDQIIEFGKTLDEQNIPWTDIWPTNIMINKSGLVVFIDPLPNLNEVGHYIPGTKTLFTVYQNTPNSSIIRDLIKLGIIPTSSTTTKRATPIAEQANIKTTSSYIQKLPAKDVSQDYASDNQETRSIAVGDGVGNAKDSHLGAKTATQLLLRTTSTSNIMSLSQIFSNIFANMQTSKATQFVQTLHDDIVKNYLSKIQPSFRPRTSTGKADLTKLDKNTTISGLSLIEKNGAQYYGGFGLGDSPIFLLRKGTLYLLTTNGVFASDPGYQSLIHPSNYFSYAKNDQAYSQQNIDEKGVVSPYQLGGSTDTATTPYVFFGKAEPGDIFFATSDGLVKNIKDPNILREYLSKTTSTVELFDMINSNQNIFQNDDWSGAMIRIPVNQSTSSDCSSCAVPIQKLVTNGISATTGTDSNRVILELNDHTFNKPHIQKSLEIIAFALKGDITHEPFDYNVALQKINEVRKLLDQVGKDIKGGEETIDISGLDQLHNALQAIAKTLPVNGTVAAKNIQDHYDALDQAETYIIAQLALPTTKKSNFVTKYISGPLFNLQLFLNRSYGDLKRPVGIISDSAQLMLELETRSAALLNSFFRKVGNINFTSNLLSTSIFIQNEEDYLEKTKETAPKLADIYSNPQSSYENHQIAMNAYIEPGRLAKSSNIAEVKQRAYYEADRLLGDYGKRNNASKEALLHDFINLYLGKMEEAIAAGSVKLSGPGSISMQEIQSMLIEEIHLLAYQDYVDTENLLGDHGLRHLFEHNTKVTFDILDKLKAQGKDIKAIDYLAAMVIQDRHDLGYTNPTVREGINTSRFGIDNGHNVLSARYFREQLENNLNHPLSRLFNKEQVAIIHEAILKHDIAPINLASSDIRDLILSAVTIADNTHAFETKLPELLYGYPESLKAMRILKAIGETIPKDDPQYQILIDQTKQALIKSIRDNPDWGPDDKTALILAATQLDPQQWSFNVGRISGNNPTFTLNPDGSFRIEVIGSETHRHITQLFNQQEYLQLAKFIADLTKENKKDVLAKMNANQTEFGNGLITIRVITSQEELTTKKTDYQTAIEKLLTGDTDLQTYNNEDNKLAKDLAYQEALLVTVPDDSSVLLEISTIKAKRRQLFEEYYAQNNQNNTPRESLIPVKVEKPPIKLNKFLYLGIKFAEPITKFIADLPDTVELLPEPYSTIFSFIGDNYEDFIIWIKSINPTLTNLRSGLSTPSLTPIQSSQMSTSERAYVTSRTDAKDLYDIYNNAASSSQKVHQAAMTSYIKPVKIVSTQNMQINDIKQHALIEADRLMDNYQKRNNSVKHALLHDFINLYLGKMEEAIAAGSVKLSGPGSISMQEIQSMLIEEIHLLAYQDYVDTENLLGDHGLRHLFEHNTKVTFDILDKLKAQGKDIKAIDYLAAMVIQDRHDLGYTNPTVREGINTSRFGIDNGHNVLSARYFREQLENNLNHPLSRLFNKEQVAIIHEAILKHDIAPINLASSDIRDLILSAVTIADNTHAFETKLPELLYGYPESLKAMRILKAIGETIPKDDPQYQILIDQTKQALIKSIRDNPDWGPDDKTALILAATQLDPQQWSFNVGRISGNNPTFTLNPDGSFRIEVIGSETHRHITQLFNQQEYLQLAKFIADLTKENKKDVLAKMNANQTEFGNGLITIRVITSQEELTTKKTDYQTAIEKLLTGDTDLQTYNNEDNKLAKDLAYNEAQLIVSTGDESLIANLDAIKKYRRQLLMTYLEKKPLSAISDMIKENKLMLNSGFKPSNIPTFIDIPIITADQVNEKSAIVVDSESNQFTITKHLGGGAYGDVYLATNNLTSKEVVVKIAKNNPEAYNLTIEEFQYLKYIEGKLENSQLQYFANAQSLIHFKESENLVGYVLDYIPGITLEEYLQNNDRLSDSLMQEIINFANILDTKNLPWNDIWVGNIIVTPDNHIVYIDPISPNASIGTSDNRAVTHVYADKNSRTRQFIIPHNSSNLKTLDRIINLRILGK